MGVSRYPVMPSLMALQQMRNRQQLATLGKKLMKWTMMAAGKELRRLAQDLCRGYLTYGEDMRLAYIKLARARFFVPFLNDIVTQNHPRKSKLTIASNTKNSSGFKIIRYYVLDSREDAYPHLGIAQGGQAVQDAKETWSMLVKKIIHIIELRTSFEHVAMVHLNATKKYHAMTKILIPRITCTIQYIGSELEEDERQETFRLKRFKELKTKTIKRETKSCRHCHRVLPKSGTVKHLCVKCAALFKNLLLGELGEKAIIETVLDNIEKVQTTTSMFSSRLDIRANTAEDEDTDYETDDENEPRVRTRTKCICSIEIIEMYDKDDVKLKDTEQLQLHVAEPYFKSTSKNFYPSMNRFNISKDNRIDEEKEEMDDECYCPPNKINVVPRNVNLSRMSVFGSKLTLSFGNQDKCICGIICKCTPKEPSSSKIRRMAIFAKNERLSITGLESSLCSCHLTKLHAPSKLGYRRSSISKSSEPIPSSTAIQESVVVEDCECPPEDEPKKKEDKLDEDGKADEDKDDDDDKDDEDRMLCICSSYENKVYENTRKISSHKEMKFSQSKSDVQGKVGVTMIGGLQLSSWTSAMQNATIQQFNHSHMKIESQPHQVKLHPIAALVSVIPKPAVFPLLDSLYIVPPALKIPNPSILNRQGSPYEEASSTKTNNINEVSAGLKPNITKGLPSSLPEPSSPIKIMDDPPESSNVEKNVKEIIKISRKKNSDGTICELKKKITIDIEVKTLDPDCGYDTEMEDTESSYSESLSKTSNSLQSYEHVNNVAQNEVVKKNINKSSNDGPENFDICTSTENHYDNNLNDHSPNILDTDKNIYMMPLINHNRNKNRKIHSDKNIYEAINDFELGTKDCECEDLEQITDKNLNQHSKPLEFPVEDCGCEDADENRDENINEDIFMTHFKSKDLVAKINKKANGRIKTFNAEQCKCASSHDNKGENMKKNIFMNHSVHNNQLINSDKNIYKLIKTLELFAKDCKFNERDKTLEVYVDPCKCKGLDENKDINIYKPPPTLKQEVKDCICEDLVENINKNLVNKPGKTLEVSTDQCECEDPDNNLAKNIYEPPQNLRENKKDCKCDDLDENKAKYIYEPPRNLKENIKNCKCDDLDDNKAKYIYEPPQNFKENIKDCKCDDLEETKAQNIYKPLQNLRENKKDCKCDDLDENKTKFIYEPPQNLKENIKDCKCDDLDENKAKYIYEPPQNLKENTKDCKCDYFDENKAKNIYEPPDILKENIKDCKCDDLDENKVKNIYEPPQILKENTKDCKCDDLDENKAKFIYEPPQILKENTKDCKCDYFDENKAKNIYEPPDILKENIKDCKCDDLDENKVKNIYEPPQILKENTKDCKCDDLDENKAKFIYEPPQILKENTKDCKCDDLDENKVKNIYEPPDILKENIKDCKCDDLDENKAKFIYEPPQILKENIKECKCDDLEDNLNQNINSLSKPVKINTEQCKCDDLHENEAKDIYKQPQNFVGYIKDCKCADLEENINKKDNGRSKAVKNYIEQCKCDELDENNAKNIYKPPQSLKENVKDCKCDDLEQNINKNVNEFSKTLEVSADQCECEDLDDSKAKKIYQPSQNLKENNKVCKCEDSEENNNKTVKEPSKTMEIYTNQCKCEDLEQKINNIINKRSKTLEVYTNQCKCENLDESKSNEPPKTVKEIMEECKCEAIEENTSKTVNEPSKTFVIYTKKCKCDDLDENKTENIYKRAENLKEIRKKCKCEDLEDKNVLEQTEKPNLSTESCKCFNLEKNINEKNNERSTDSRHNIVQNHAVESKTNHPKSLQQGRIKTYCDAATGSGIIDIEEVFEEYGAVSDLCEMCKQPVDRQWTTEEQSSNLTNNEEYVDELSNPDPKYCRDICTDTNDLYIFEDFIKNIVSKIINISNKSNVNQNQILEECNNEVCETNTHCEDLEKAISNIKSLKTNNKKPLLLDLFRKNICVPRCRTSAKESVIPLPIKTYIDDTLRKILKPKPFLPKSCKNIFKDKLNSCLMKRPRFMKCDRKLLPDNQIGSEQNMLSRHECTNQKYVTSSKIKFKTSNKIRRTQSNLHKPEEICSIKIIAKANTKSVPIIKNLEKDSSIPSPEECSKEEVPEEKPNIATENQNNMPTNNLPFVASPLLGCTSSMSRSYEIKDANLYDFIKRLYVPPKICKHKSHPIITSHDPESNTNIYFPEQNDYTSNTELLRFKKVNGSKKYNCPQTQAQDCDCGMQEKQNALKSVGKSKLINHSTENNISMNIPDISTCSSFEQNIAVNTNSPSLTDISRTISCECLQKEDKDVLSKNSSLEGNYVMKIKTISEINHDVQNNPIVVAEAIETPDVKTLENQSENTPLDNNKVKPTLLTSQLNVQTVKPSVDKITKSSADSRDNKNQLKEPRMSVSNPCFCKERGNKAYIIDAKASIGINTKNIDRYDTRSFIHFPYLKRRSFPSCQSCPEVQVMKSCSCIEAEDTWDT